MPIDEFRGRMKWLADHRRVLPLAEVVDCIRRGGSLPGDTVCITFDDGYLDNLTVAAPVLDELGLPATVFVATGLVDREEAPLVDRLRWMMATARPDAKLISLPGHQSFVVDTTTARERADGFRRLDTMSIGLDPEERSRLLQEVRSAFDSDDLAGRGLIMSPGSVASLVRRYPSIEIGAHGLDHLDMSALSPDRLATEIHRSVDAIREWTGWCPRLFACPYNRTSDSVQTALREAGLIAATGVGEDRAFSRSSEIWGIPRFDPAHAVWPMDVA
jgi:peptidoglycan/xylan/chitin deacetylase (PgdA/CDA1 family)